MVAAAAVGLAAVSPFWRGGAHMPQAGWLAVGAAAVGLLWAVVALAGSRRADVSPPKLHLAAPLCLLCLWAALSSLFSLYPYATLVAVCGLAAWSVYSLACCWACSWESVRRGAAWAVTLLGLFYSVYGFLQLAGVLPSDFWAVGSALASRFVNNNHFATLTGACALVAAGLAVASGRRPAGVVAGLAGVVMSAALILSRSRGGWLSFAVGAGVFVALSLRTGRGLSNKGKVILVCVVLVALAGAAFVGRGAIREGVSQMREQGFYSAVQRLDMWSGTLSMIAARPWGSGAGAFRAAYPTWRTHSDRFIVTHAHNEYLQVAAEMGIVGLALVAWASVALVRACRTAMAEDGDYMLRAGAGAALALSATHALLDFSPHIPGVALPLAVMVGIACGRRGARRSGTLAAERLGAVAVAVVCLALGACVLRLYVADRAFREGESLRAAGAWRDAAERYAHAVELAGGNTAYHERLGGIYAAWAVLGGGDDGRAAQAIEAFRSAVAACSVNANAHFQLAMLYAAEGEGREADIEFTKALRYDKVNGRFRYRYAEFLLKEGRSEETAGPASEALSFWPTRHDRRTIARFYDLGLGEELGDLVPEDAYSRLLLGSVLLERGEEGRAAAEFDLAVERSGRALWAYKAVARQWRIRARYHREAEVLEALLGAYPADAEAEEMLREARRLIEAIEDRP